VYQDYHSERSNDRTECLESGHGHGDGDGRELTSFTCKTELPGSSAYVSNSFSQRAYLRSPSLHPLSFQLYLPWREVGDQQGHTSEETPCIAQRAGDSSWMSFGASTSGIFYLTLSFDIVYLFIDGSAFGWSLKKRLWKDQKTF
jgi:hypothetical protein